MSNKCDVCGEDLVHSEIHWDLDGKQACSPDCLLELIETKTEQVGDA